MKSKDVDCWKREIETLEGFIRIRKNNIESTKRQIERQIKTGKEQIEYHEKDIKRLKKEIENQKKAIEEKNFRKNFTEAADRAREIQLIDIAIEEFEKKNKETTLLRRRK